MEREIEAYSAALEANDAVEDQMPTPTEPLGEDVAEKTAADVIFTLHKNDAGKPLLLIQIDLGDGSVTGLYPCT